MTMDYFEILGVERKAALGEEEGREAFHDFMVRAAKAHEDGPEKAFDNANAELGPWLDRVLEGVRGGGRARLEMPPGVFRRYSAMEPVASGKKT